MAEVIGAENFAYNGKTFHSFTADYSKCKRKEKQNDCIHHNGSVRTELTTKKGKIEQSLFIEKSTKNLCHYPAGLENLV